MENSSNAVIAKIQKLFALANHPSANVNEAAAAAAAAQKLLFQHKLSAADIEISGGAREAVGQLNVDEETELQLKWKQTLMAGVAHGGFCKVITSRTINAAGRKVARMMVIGKPSDAQTVSYLFAYLQNEINRLAALLCAGKGFAYANSFRVGAADAIYKRMAAQRAEQERPAANVNETALVLVKRGDGEISSFISQKFPRLRKGTGARVSRNDGFGAGQAAGRGISFGGGKGIGAAARQISA